MRISACIISAGGEDIFRSAMGTASARASKKERPPKRPASIGNQKRRSRILQIDKEACGPGSPRTIRVPDGFFAQSLPAIGTFFAHRPILYPSKGVCTRMIRMRELSLLHAPFSASLPGGTCSSIFSQMGVWGLAPMLKSCP